VGAARAEAKAVPDVRMAIYSHDEEHAMTITEALTHLTHAWPADSFSIGLDVWSHKHAHQERGEPAVTWSVYSAAEHHQYTHPTLEGAVLLALERGSVAEAEAAVEGV
jgi:hypothetical protein